MKCVIFMFLTPLRQGPYLLKWTKISMKTLKGQKCMWCDMTNSRIDMMRAPYSEQPQSQVYKDSAANSADVSTAIEWPSDTTMPDQFTLIEYTIDAKKICLAESEDAEECINVENAIEWLKDS